MEDVGRRRSSGDLFFDALDHFPPSVAAGEGAVSSSEHAFPSPARPTTAASSLRFFRRISPAARSGGSEISTVTSEVRARPRDGEGLNPGPGLEGDLGGGGESFNLGGDGDHSRVADGNGASSLLVMLAGIVLRAIVFQISFLIAVVTIPVWIFSLSASLIVSPYQTLRRAKHVVFGEVSSVYTSIVRVASPIVPEQSSDHTPWIGKYALRFGLGLLWSVYVGFVLMGLLVTAFVAGGILMKWVVEQPVQIKEYLNFDYTSAKPVAFVPVISCDGVSSGSGFREVVDDGKQGGAHVLQPNHNVQVRILLKMPESDYNRRLGVFQVSVEFVSVKGRVTSRSSHPCMLRFKSSPVRYVETFLRSGLVLVGYASETQTLKLKLEGLKEGSEPTACLRVILEQRAEFRAGAGLPEVSDAFLDLETELPFLKRVIWNWKRTTYIWTSMWIFLMELIFTMVFCHPFLLPGRDRQCLLPIEFPLLLHF